VYAADILLITFARGISNWHQIEQTIGIAHRSGQCQLFLLSIAQERAVGAAPYCIYDADSATHEQPNVSGGGYASNSKLLHYRMLRTTQDYFFEEVHYF